MTAEKARTTWNLRSPITRASDTLSPWPSATESVRDARLAAADDADADTDDAADVSPAGAVVDVVVVVVAAIGVGVWKRWQMASRGGVVNFDAADVEMEEAQ